MTSRIDAGVRHLNEKQKRQLQDLAREHGTPLFVVDLGQIRRNYTEFKEALPRVQAYYAIKANPDPVIIKTLFDMGSSFDVASMPEFRRVYENVKGMPDKERYDWVWDRVIYANTIKPTDTLKELNVYKPLVTFDNKEELRKIKEYAPDAGLALRIRVPNHGSVVELSSKFGAEPREAVGLISEAFDKGLNVEGLSFHVGSQCTNFENYAKALTLASDIMKESEEKTGKTLKLLDIGGGFPAKYKEEDMPFKAMARKVSAEIDRLFPVDRRDPSKTKEILAEPGRRMVANACTIVAEVIGKAERDGRQCYYINDGVYSTYSGQLFDHINYPVLAFKKGNEKVSAVLGPTCDALDTITLNAILPELEIKDLVYSENIGAYSNASATRFNGFEPAKIVYINA